MTIVHWYPNFQGGGGVSTAVGALARAQSELGHTVLIATAGGRKAPLYGPLRVDARVGLYEWKPSYALRVGRQALRILGKTELLKVRELKPDVVHIHGEFNPDNLWVPRLFERPIILSPHGGFHPAVLKKGRRWQKAAYVALARCMLYRRATAFHAMCPAEMAHIDQLIPGSPVYCVPHGSDTSAVDTSAVSGTARVQILFVGRLDVYTKGLDILLDAFAIAARSSRQDILLNLVGPDWDGGAQQLQNQAVRLGIAHQVAFHGGCTPDKVASLMREADLYIQLSRHDGFPLSVAEALLAQKPVILSREVGTTSFKEISSRPHVQVVSPTVSEAAAAITTAIHQLPHLRLSAARDRECLGTFFSWKRIATAHVDAYSASQSPYAGLRQCIRS